MMTRAQFGSIVGAILSIGIAALGTSNLFRIHRLTTDQDRSIGWSQTNGTIVSSHIRTETSGGRIATTETYLDLQYQYGVDGRTHTGSDWYYHYNLVTDKHAKDHLAEYPPNAPVAVYCDPDDEEHAVLHTGRAPGLADGDLTLTYFFGWTAVVMGVGFFGAMSWPFVKRKWLG